MMKDRTIHVDDTVTVDGLPGRWVVDDIYPGNDYNPPRMGLSRAYRTRERHLRSEATDINDFSRVHLVRFSNRDKADANAVLAAAGLPLI